MAIFDRLLMITLTGALALAGRALPASAADAENTEEIQAGRRLAITLCSPCHLVSEKASEPRSSPPPGPSFREIAKGPKASPEALGDFLRSTHNSVAHPGAMPNPQLTEQQIKAIAAYMVSLRPAR